MIARGERPPGGGLSGATDATLWHERAAALSNPAASPFVQCLLPVTQQRRQQVAQDRARTGLYFHRCRHAGRQVDDAVIDLHLRAVERDARGVVELLALRLARFVGRSRCAIVGAVLLAITDDGILRRSEERRVG